MNNYEAMILMRPDLSEEERKVVFDKIRDAIDKKGGQIEVSDIWAEKKRLAFNISSALTSGGLKRYGEALFYLVNFKIASEAITQLRSEFKLNDSIIRVLIVKRSQGLVSVKSAS
ncbi:MAG: 30S ribosomal protein S6 [Candidatus Omnitrophica bacterium]|nr:30S ribosomal protein S6 [Candidatus Omnitrophota bacterium]